MKLCDDHWAKLRAAIDERGLSGFISSDGEAATKILAEQLTNPDAPATVDNFDPLMNANMAIWSNTMGTLGPNAMYLMTEGEPDPVDEKQYPLAAGRTWPKCPICYLNLAHELTCKDAGCKLDVKRGYDFYIERAADDQAKRAEELGS